MNEMSRTGAPEPLDLRWKKVFRSDPAIDDVHTACVGWVLHGHCSAAGALDQGIPPYGWRLKINTIAHEARVNPDTARDRVWRLASLGRIRIHEHPGRSNIYQLVDPEDWESARAEFVPPGTSAKDADRAELAVPAQPPDRLLALLDGDVEEFHRELDRVLTLENSGASTLYADQPRL